MTSALRRAVFRSLTLLALGPVTSWGAAGLVAGNQVWSGLVRVEEDVLVPPGATLTVLPGTRVVFAPASGTKTEPWFWTPGTELTVAGRLVAEGTPGLPVVFEGEGPWGGIAVAPGGEAHLSRVRVAGPDEGLMCAGFCELADARIEGAEYGLVLAPGSRLAAARVTAVGCRVGLLDARTRGGAVEGVEVQAPRDAPLLTLPGPPRGVASVELRTAGRPGVEYVGEHSVEADEVWRGEVVVSGRVTVVPGAVLTLEAGTRVAFRKIDTNGDGLGESELLVLGGIRSLGAPGRPVVFESAEPSPQPGDWDKVSLISSEDPDNVFRHSVFRWGTQALHAHFSRFSAEECLFEDNLRAVQFQESDGALLRECVFLRNKQALRFRDSRARVAESLFIGNFFGVHVFRGDVEFTDNTLEGSSLGGFLAKESRVVFQRNRLAGNRDGVRMKDIGSWALIRGNRFGSSAEDSLSLSHVEGSVEENRFEGAGLDLASVEESPVVFRGNFFGATGRDALHLKGATGVDARGNYWGAAAPATRIHDREDSPELGTASLEPALPAPPQLALPPAEW